MARWCRPNFTFCTPSSHASTRLERATSTSSCSRALHWPKTSGSAVQVADVKDLLGSVPDLDWAYLEKWSGDLGVAEALAEARV
jgi:hypothetical protein